MDEHTTLLTSLTDEWKTKLAASEGAQAEAESQLANAESRLRNEIETVADQKQAAFLQQHDAQLQALKIDHAKELAVTESALENAKKALAGE